MFPRIPCGGFRSGRAGFPDGNGPWGKGTRQTTLKTTTLKTSTCDLHRGRVRKKATKNRPGKKFQKAGITLSPACLATYLTWLQAGRLKSPRDKSCCIRSHPFRQGGH